MADDKMKKLQESIDNDFIKFETKIKSEISGIKDDDIKEYLYIILDVAIFVGKSKASEQVNFVPDKSLLKKQDKMFDDVVRKYTEWRDEEIAKEDQRVKDITKRKRQKKDKSGRDILPTNFEYSNKKQRKFALANKIVYKIEDFVKTESDNIDRKAKSIKVKRGSDILGKGVAGAASIALGTGLPLALWEGRHLPMELKRNLFNNKGGRLATAGQVAAGAAGILGGSAAGMVLASDLGQLAGRGRQKYISNKAEQERFEERIAGFGTGGSAKSKGSRRTIGSLSSVDERELRSLIKSIMDEEKGKLHPAKKGGIFDVMGGPDSGIGAMIKNLRVHKGEQVIVKPATDKSSETLKSIDSKLASISRSSEKLASIAEESYEDSQDAAARAGLAQKKDKSFFGGIPSLKRGGMFEKAKGMAPKAIGMSAGAGVGFGIGSWLSSKAEESGMIEEGGIGSKILKGGGALLGGLAGNWLAGKMAKAGLGTGTREGQPVYITNWNEAPSMGGGGGGSVFDAVDMVSRRNKTKAGSKVGNLVKRMMGRGGKGGATAASKSGSIISRIAGKSGGLGRVLGKGAGMLGKAGPLLGGLAKFAGPVGLAITAGMAAKDAYSGWNNAASIAGLKEGEKATTLQKAGAGISGALSSLTMGLVSPETMYKGVSTAAKYSPLGLLSMGMGKLFGGDGESATPVPTSPAMALSNIDSTPVPPMNAYQRRHRGESKVSQIKGNTDAAATMSEVARMKVAEAKVDARNMRDASKGTEEAINRISMVSNSPAPAPQVVIYTGDMDSFASRLAKSY